MSWVGWVFDDVVAIWRQQELYSSSKESRGHPIIFWAVVTTPFSALLSATVQLARHTHTHTHAVRQHTTSGSVVEGHKQFLGEVVLPEETQKVESLMCLLNQCCCVGWVPQQVAGLIAGDPTATPALCSCCWGGSPSISCMLPWLNYFSVEAGSVSTILCPITKPKCSIFLPWQPQDFSHPGLRVGLDPDALVHRVWLRTAAS